MKRRPARGGCVGLQEIVMDCRATMPPALRLGRRQRLRRGHGFTLTELLTVIGLIALLVSLFMPVLGKVRAAANTANCLSNVRHIGVAWLGYVAENSGRLPDYVWHLPAKPESAYYGYWTGIVDRNGVRGEALRCPAARDAFEAPRDGGWGDVSHAWTGRVVTNGSAVRLSAQSYRESSYGFNAYLTAGNGFGRNGSATYLSSVNNLANVPMFFDCAYPDARPVNATEAVPARSPPNVRGDKLDVNSPDHWRFLLGR